MNEKGQNDIYYIIGENIAPAFSSPFLETIRKKIEAQPNYFIKIIPDKVNLTITIEDSGIGMMRNEMINNLGTIAKWNTELIMYLEKIEA
eukprot:2785942-Heterocapsa_arctica.AAC.1